MAEPMDFHKDSSQRGEPNPSPQSEQHQEFGQDGESDRPSRRVQFTSFPESEQDQESGQDEEYDPEANDLLDQLAGSDFDYNSDDFEDDLDYSEEEPATTIHADRVLDLGRKSLAPMSRRDQILANITATQPDVDVFLQSRRETLSGFKLLLPALQKQAARAQKSGQKHKQAQGAGEADEGELRRRTSPTPPSRNTSPEPTRGRKRGRPPGSRGPKSPFKPETTTASSRPTRSRSPTKKV